MEIRKYTTITYSNIGRIGIIGKYKDYDVTNLIIIVAALLYVVSPIDLIPDFLPVGLTDDAAIIMWAISEMKNELDKYKQFKSQ